MQIHPVSTSAADLFFWQTQVSIASNVAGANVDYAEFQSDSDKCLVLMAYTGSTNYDAFAGDVIAEVGNPLAAAVAGITPPFVPNNFQVSINVNSDWFLTGLNPVPQACLASNSYRTGTQFVVPTIFPPMTKFNFEFTNIARTLQLDAAGAARDLVINFGFMGYFVYNAKMSDFLETFDEYACQAQGPISAWLKKFTDIDARPFE